MNKRQNKPDADFPKDLLFFGAPGLRILFSAANDIESRGEPFKSKLFSTLKTKPESGNEERLVARG